MHHSGDSEPHRRLVIVIAVLIVAMVLPFAPAAAARERDNGRRVDALFKKWNGPDSPGAVVTVIRDGRTVYARGYGMASLEHGLPLAPDTAFHLASLSKQFTGFAIHLLAEDGKLSLDDDVRKHLPALHAHASPVTLRHLLHHTSGVRDQWALLVLAGWRLNDVITTGDVRRLLEAQTELNFPPGERFLYSNSGYTLLGLVVERVSGISLAAFAKTRIFDPLGMVDTRFQTDYGAVVKGRAYSYAPGPSGGYRYVALSYSTVGPSSLFSTARDLARWDENFYSRKIGGASALGGLQAPGRLKNSEPIPYASGLSLAEYRGRATVAHSGADAGYRTNMLRFPSERFTVIVLSNAADLDPTALSERIADIYLEDRFTAPAPDQTSTTEYVSTAFALSPEQLEPILGRYELTPTFAIRFTREEGRLVFQATGQGKVALTASSPTRFFSDAVRAEFVFDAAGSDGKVTGATLRQHGREIPMKRAELVPLSEDEIRQRAGAYYSDELGVIYQVSATDRALSLRHPRADLALESISKDAFAASIGVLRFACGDQGPCTGFLIDSGWVENLRFRRVELSAPAGPAP